MISIKVTGVETSTGTRMNSETYSPEVKTKQQTSMMKAR